MPEYLAPGVYVEETLIGGKPIEGVSTSTAGFLGVAERGPSDPRLVSSMREFLGLYGGHAAGSHLTACVDGFFTNGGQRCVIARVDAPESKRASLTISGIELEAIGTGAWGNRLAARIDSADGTFNLALTYWAEAPPARGGVVLVDPHDAARDPQLARSEVGRAPSHVEVYEELSVDPTTRSFFGHALAGSQLVRVSQATLDGPPSAAPASEQATLFSGGCDVAIDLAAYTGAKDDAAGATTGLRALEEVDEISIVCAPDESDVDGLTGALVAHCEAKKDRFAILQAPQSAGDVADLTPPDVGRSRYAAFYYPWIRVLDAVSGTRRLVPPGGHVAGIYARSDVQRGVHRAPANERVLGAVALQFPVTQDMQDVLHPRGVNCLRELPGRGIVVWGARTTSSDPEWKYVNVRRLFLYLEESIERATRWVVFEPNDARLWSRVRQSVVSFLAQEWRSGALMGSTPDEAFFVQCGRPDTMTDDDVESGRLIMLIGVAPTRPAEFVVFRVVQRSGDTGSAR